MREVERARFVRTRPRELDALLDPARIVEYEGSFSVDSTTETDAGTLLTVSGPGLAFELRFEPIENGTCYTQAGADGPFEPMETWLTAAPEDEGSRVSMRSAVSLGVPLPFVDRVAAWTRARTVVAIGRHCTLDCTTAVRSMCNYLRSLVYNGRSIGSPRRSDTVGPAGYGGSAVPTGVRRRHTPTQTLYGSLRKPAYGIHRQRERGARLVSEGPPRRRLEGRVLV
jgi:hypothetical protein